MTEKELLQLKEKVEKAKQSKARLEGQKEQLLQQLKKEFGCSTLKEAEKRLKKMEEDVEKKREEYAELVEIIEEKYNLNT